MGAQIVDAHTPAPASKIAERVKVIRIFFIMDCYHVGANMFVFQFKVIIQIICLILEKNLCLRDYSLIDILNWDSTYEKNWMKLMYFTTADSLASIGNNRRKTLRNAARYRQAFFLGL